MTRTATGMQSFVFKSLSEAEADWQQLKDVAYGNPYQTFDWLKAWHETLGIKQQIETIFAIGRLDGRTSVILPLGLQSSAGVRTLSFLGHQDGNQNTGIWDPSFYGRTTDEDIRTLLEAACKAANADLLWLQNVPHYWQGRKHPLLQANSTASPSPVFQRDLGDGFEDLFKATHSKSSRKNLLRKQKHLLAAGGYHVAKAGTPGEVKTGLAAFLEQRATRAAEAGIPNAFSEPAAQDFLKRLLGLTAGAPSSELNALELWYLETAGKIRSTYLCTEHSGVLYAYANSVAHDDMLANSPGLVLIKEIIERACSRPDLRLLDLGLGEERYKTAWAEPVPLQDSLLAFSFKGRLKLHLDMMGTRLKATVRNSDRLWQIVRQVRKWKASRTRTSGSTGT